MTNVGAAWLLTVYRDPEARMVASCRKGLLGALREAGQMAEPDVGRALRRERRS